MAQTPRALEVPQPDQTDEAGWELAVPVRWVRANPVLATGLLLIAAQLWWKAGFVGQSFFRLDDYFYLEHASTQGLTWSYLTWVDAGHLNVVGSAIAWVLVRIAPEDWTLATATTLVLLGCACLALLRMLRTLFGDRPSILLLLGFYLLSPLSLPGLSWWTVALEQLPLQLAIFCAITAHVHYLRTKEFKHALAAAAWLVVALLSSFQGAAVPLLLFVITSAFFAQGAWSRALWPVLREHWRAWSLYLALTAAYVPLYLIRLTGGSQALIKPTAFADVLDYGGTLLRETFVPGAFGGPWRWSLSGVEALTDPPSALAWLSWVLAVLVVLASLMYAWRAWRAWAILAGWLVAVDIVPVLAGRSSLVSAAVLGLSARYVWDITGILVLCLGLAFIPLVGGPGPRRSPRRLSRPEFAAATTVVVAVVFGSIWSFYDYPADPTASAASSYIATARLALAEAPSRAVILDDPVPSDVAGGLFVGATGQASGVLSPLRAGLTGGGPTFITQPDGTYNGLLEFNGYGQLVPVGIYGVASQPVPAGGSCWPANGDGDIVVPLNSTATGVRTLRIGYIAASPARVRVTFGPRSMLASVKQGLNSVYVPVLGATARSVVISQYSGAMPCIGSAAAGALLPSESGPALPSIAVAG